MREENLRDPLNQLPTPVILIGDFTAENPLWRGEIRHKMKMLGKIIDKYVLCLNEKKKHIHISPPNISRNVA